MKVQHGAVSENSVHNYCVPRTVIWTSRFVLSRQTWRNLRHGLRSNVLWALEVCQSQSTLLSRIWCDCMTAVMRQWHELCWNRVGSRVCCFLSALCRYPCCVSVSTAQCRAHTHLMCHLLAPYKSCVSHPCIARACTDCDPTIWYFILFYFTLSFHFIFCHFLWISIMFFLFLFFFFLMFVFFCYFFSSIYTRV